MTEIVVIALDSFKGTIGAARACAAVRDGWKSKRPDHDLRLFPMADGGEGTLDAFAATVPGATHVPITVTGPEDAPIETSWLLLPATADAPAGTGVVELAGTSGIELLGTPPRLRPLDAHTRGFGEAIASALKHGVSRLVLGIGSSSSTDGGVGMLTSLGARFEGRGQRSIRGGGRGLADLVTVDLSQLAAPPTGGVTVLTDVTSPLLGPVGAAATFGPQKGANDSDVTLLDHGLAHLADVLGLDPDTPGAGAAGGTGYGLLAWGADLVPGASTVADLIGLTHAIREASVVVTGEGSFDGQSAAGKVPSHVASLSHARHTPVGLIAGRIDPGASTSGFAAHASLTELAGSSEAAMREPAHWLRQAGARLAEQFRER